MNMFKRIYDYWNGSDEDRAKWARESEESKFNARIEADKLDAEMIDSYCPIVNGKCRVTCVHFQKAVVMNSHSTIGCDNTHWVAIKPRCKLWKR
jgi:hypothetical protein